MWWAGEKNSSNWCLLDAKNPQFCGNLFARLSTHSECHAKIKLFICYVPSGNGHKYEHFGLLSVTVSQNAHT